MKTPEESDYHTVHLNRYLTTIEYLADLPKTTRALEVGAPPYGMTVLLANWLFDRVSVSGYDEKAVDQLQKTSQRNMSIVADNGVVLYEGEERRFNLEIHQWPYPDGEFDLVISCETFEHLGLDPMHAYAEANRVLAPGGRLFVTVPNGMALSNGLRYLDGRQANSFPVYRPEGYALRHCREPTPREVGSLMRAAGFEPEFIETINIEKVAPGGLAMVVLGLLARPLKLRRELLVARGIKRGPVADRYPTEHELYFSWDVDRLRRNPAITSHTSSDSTANSHTTK